MAQEQCRATRRCCPGNFRKKYLDCQSIDDTAVMLGNRRRSGRGIATRSAALRGNGSRRARGQPALPCRRLFAMRQRTESPTAQTAAAYAAVSPNTPESIMMGGADARAPATMAHARMRPADLLPSMAASRSPATPSTSHGLTRHPYSSARWLMAHSGSATGSSALIFSVTGSMVTRSGNSASGPAASHSVLPMRMAGMAFPFACWPRVSARWRLRRHRPVQPTGCHLGNPPPLAVGPSEVRAKLAARWRDRKPRKLGKIDNGSPGSHRLRLKTAATRFSWYPPPSTQTRYEKWCPCSSPDVIDLLIPRIGQYRVPSAFRLCPNVGEYYAGSLHGGGDKEHRIKGEPEAQMFQEDRFAMLRRDVGLHKFPSSAGGSAVAPALSVDDQCPRSAVILAGEAVDGTAGLLGVVAVILGADAQKARVPKQYAYEAARNPIAPRSSRRSSVRKSRLSVISSTPCSIVCSCIRLWGASVEGTCMPSAS